MGRTAPPKPPTQSARRARRETDRSPGEKNDPNALSLKRHLRVSVVSVHFRCFFSFFRFSKGLQGTNTDAVLGCQNDGKTGNGHSNAANAPFHGFLNVTNQSKPWTVHTISHDMIHRNTHAFLAPSAFLKMILALEALIHSTYLKFQT